MSLSEHARRNRAAWDAEADQWVEPGRRNWQREEPKWGMWDLPERELNVLGDVSGKDVIELGCGTAYWSAWLARRGARVVGLDNSERQLETARSFQREFALQFPLVHASAEDVPFPYESFDVAFSEYGASTWCNPYLWVPEAARVLRPGGLLAFLQFGTLLVLCLPSDGSVPARESLQIDYFGIHRFEWPGEDGVEFHVGYGDWIRLLRRSGLVVEDLLELQAPEGAATRFDFVTPEWARRWPSEQIWKARKER